MLLLFFFLPHSCATASDFRKRKTPSVRSSHLINPGCRSGFSRMSLINSHRWVPLGSVGRDSRCLNKNVIELVKNKKMTTVHNTYWVFWPDRNDLKTFWHLRETIQVTDCQCLWATFLIILVFLITNCIMRKFLTRKRRGWRRNRSEGMTQGFIHVYVTKKTLIISLLFIWSIFKQSISGYNTDNWYNYSTSGCIGDIRKWTGKIYCNDGKRRGGWKQNLWGHTDWFI